MSHELHTLEAHIERALSGLSATQTQLTPTAHPEKWSIQQIVHHLLLTYSSTLSVLQARIDKRTPTQATPTLYQRLAQFAVLTLGRFPHGRTSPAAVAPPIPTRPLSGEELSHEAQAELHELESVASQAQALFAAGRCASHAVFGPLSIPQWRRFHLLHCRHHVNQILAIRRDHGL